VTAADTLPDHVDWREKGVVTAVKDQGGCGSCWAFAAAATLESHIAIETGTLFNLAPQEFVSCMPNPNKCGGAGGCQGATVDMAFDWMEKKGGIVSEYVRAKRAQRRAPKKTGKALTAAPSSPHGRRV
jgi:cathepsin L